MGSDHAMKTRQQFPQPGRTLKRNWAMIAVALLLAAGLFIASVFLPPFSTPVQALNAPSAAASQAPNSAGVNGTLASFTALFPQMMPVYVPIITR
jgi:hypothetical protein